MPERVLLTGGTGFIGQRLALQLLDAGYHVTLLVRESYSLGTPLPPALAGRRAALELAPADIRNYALTARAVQSARPDVIVHLAAAGVTDPFLPLETALRHNLYGTLHVLRAAWASAGRRVLVGRTPGERAPANVYTASKAAAWRFAKMYARSQGWPVTGLMIFQTYGAGQPGRTLIPAALAAALNGADFPMTSGNQQRDWVAVEDVAAGIAAAVQTPTPAGVTLELGTGRLTSLVEVVQQVYTLVGRGGRPRPGMLPDRPGEVDHRPADADAAAALIGWRARLSLTEGLRQLVQQAMPKV